MPLRTRRLVASLLLLAAFVVLVDQLTKEWALANLTEGVREPLLGDLLGLTLVFNPGAALSIASGTTWIFTLAAIGVSVAILRVAPRLGSRGWAVGLGLMLGGALGNLLDRLLREPGFAVGHVVDFIAYLDWFVGNVADIAIVAAAVLVVLLSLRGIGVDGLRMTDQDAPPAEETPSDDVAGPATATDTDPAGADPGSTPATQHRAGTTP